MATGARAVRPGALDDEETKLVEVLGASPPPPRKRVLDLFSGGGGFALGFRNAGHDHALNVDRFEPAVETLRSAGFQVVLGDVGDVELYRDLDPVDIIVAGPPCQGFSSAGLRLGAKDPRNGFPALWKALDAVETTWLLIENVSGLRSHSERYHPSPELCAGCYFEEEVLVQVQDRFEVVEWKLLDAADYGVPQNRLRLFVVAGPRRFDWPAPTHASEEERSALGLFAGTRLPWRTSGEALGLFGVFRETRGRGAAERHGRRPDIPTTRPSPTITSGGKRAAGPRYKFIAAADVGEAKTGDVSKGRPLTPEEGALLQAFPRGYSFEGGTKGARWIQIGNAVPPPLAEALARSFPA